MSDYVHDAFGRGAGHQFYAFIVIPLLDLITGETTDNLEADEAAHKKTQWIFDAMLYLNVPIVFCILAYGLLQVQTGSYERFEMIGLALSGGILLATNGINVAHEFGHRKSMVERLMSKLLYMPCLYMHFFIEHNYGHHLRVDYLFASPGNM